MSHRVIFYIIIILYIYMCSRVYRLGAVPKKKLIYTRARTTSEHRVYGFLFILFYIIN